MKSITFVVVMQRLVTSILVMALLVALATGCGRARYDARLVQADSLMWTAPDSALATLAAIDSLAGEANQAYRDLLMTQARYRTYADITASDDSAITRAMDYYRAHSGQREKLTRACLYKGAVMEELNHIDSAMYYYKTAEAAADTTDYLNLGQINTRIADLYRRYHGDMQVCYEKSMQALQFYRLMNNKHLQLPCMIMVASSSGVIHKENSERLLNEASQLAIELNDSASYYMCQELLCRQLLHNSKSYNRSKQIALDCYYKYSSYVNQNLLLDLADIYACTGMLDSARHFIDELKHRTHFKISGQSSARLYFILSRISLLDGDSVQSAIYDKQGHEVSDSILNNKVKYRIHQVESNFNLAQSKQNQSKFSHLQWMIIASLVVGLTIIIFITYFSLRKWHLTRAIIRDLKNAQIIDHEDLLNQLDTKSAVIERLLSNLVSLLKYCSGDEVKDSTSEISKQIKETITEVANDDFWNELRGFLDRNHGGIISKFEQMYSLKEKDLKFLELTCCGFSHAEIAIILNYSPKYVFSKRKILAQKMGLDMPLQDYVNSLMGKNQQD